ncbi:MAG: rRNA maturation RNase YbeY [Phycisphaerales bacterium]|nr:MAG: rRNA maturation RNase YbeY [Phycisphaerales bacterium]
MIVVEITKSFQNIEADLSRLKELIGAICSHFKLLSATVSVAIVDDAEMRRLNAKFLNHNSTTDCLSFDLSDDEALASDRSFEVVVNGERAVTEAHRRGHSSEAELALYVTHGLLHNLGFDDSTAEQAEKMHSAEDEFLQHSGYGLVYNRSERAREHKNRGSS